MSLTIRDIERWRELTFVGEYNREAIVEYFWEGLVSNCCEWLVDKFRTSWVAFFSITKVNSAKSIFSLSMMSSPPGISARFSTDVSVRKGTPATQGWSQTHSFYKDLYWCGNLSCCQWECFEVGEVHSSMTQKFSWDFFHFTFQKFMHTNRIESLSSELSQFESCRSRSV